MLTSDDRAVLDRLERWQAQCDEILRMIDARQPIQRIREAYTKFKRGLEKDYRAGSTRRGRSELSESEQRWYQHTVHEAFCHLYARVNGQPDQIFSSVYEVKIDIGHTIHSMRAMGRREDEGKK